MDKQIQELELRNAHLRNENVKLFEDNRQLAAALHEKSQIVKSLLKEKSDFFAQSRTRQMVPYAEYQLLRNEFVKTIHAADQEIAQLRTFIAQSQQMQVNSQFVTGRALASAPSAANHEHRRSSAPGQLLQASQISPQSSPNVAPSISQLRRQTMPVMTQAHFAYGNQQQPIQQPQSSQLKVPSDNSDRQRINRPNPGPSNPYVHKVMSEVPMAPMTGNPVSQNSTQTYAIYRSNAEQSPHGHLGNTPNATRSHFTSVPTTQPARHHQSNMHHHSPPSIDTSSAGITPQQQLHPISSVRNTPQSSHSQQIPYPNFMLHDATRQPAQLLPDSAYLASTPTPSSALQNALAYPPALLQQQTTLSPIAPETDVEFTGPGLSPEASGGNRLSSTPSEPIENRCMEDDSRADTARVATSPTLGDGGIKRSAEAMSENSLDIPREPHKKLRLSDESATHPITVGNEPTTEDDDDSESEVEIGPDGLRTVKDCLSHIFTSDEDDSELKTCGFCYGRYQLKAIDKPPEPFKNATDDELHQHCLIEHEEVWNHLRQRV